MACCLVAIDKLPGVRPAGIGETLRRSIAKLVMRAAGYQAKMTYKILQLCAGLEASIKGETHAMVQKWQERIATALEERAEVESEEGITAGEDNKVRGEIATIVMCVGEVPEPMAVGNVTGEGKDEGGARDKIRNVTETMDVREEKMVERDEVDLGEDNVEE